MSGSTSEFRVRFVPLNMLKPFSNFISDQSKAVLLLWIIFVIYFHVFFFIVPCNLAITCLERADLLALLCMMFSCVLALSHRCAT